MMKNENDSYKVKVVLLNDKNDIELFRQKLELPQSACRFEEFQLPSLTGIELIKVIIKSDSFIPKDLGISVDSRNLEIVIITIFLVGKGNNL